MHTNTPTHTCSTSERWSPSVKQNVLNCPCWQPSWDERLDILSCMYFVPHPQSIADPLDLQTDAITGICVYRLILSGFIDCWHFKMSRRGGVWNVSLSQCNYICDPKLFFLFGMSKTQCSSSLRFYFAHAVKGTLKGTDQMFVLHSLFQIDEYFIQMNNKYAFFLPDDVSTLVFTAAQAFSVLRSLSLSLTPLLSLSFLNYLVAWEMFSFITITLHSVSLLKTYKAASDYARGFSLLLI